MVYSVVGLFTAKGFFSSLGYLTQMLMPFFVYFSLKLSSRERRDEASFENFVLAVNLFTPLACAMVFFLNNKFDAPLQADGASGRYDFLTWSAVRNFLQRKGVWKPDRGA